MGVNWEEIKSIKQKKPSSLYRGRKETPHATIGGKGKVAQALQKKKSRGR